MIRQKTIRDPVVIEGTGLQTGSYTKLVLKGAPADSGINFIRMDLPDKPLINIQSLSFDNFSFRRRRTALKKGRVEIQTTEHLLSAIYGSGINNITIEISGAELPALDGSAKEYLEAIARAAIIEQDAPVKELIVEKEAWCARNDAFLAAFPHDGFRVSYFLSYPVKSIGEQFLTLDITEDIFKREIAPARTFCMSREALFLKITGFGRGADFKNTLIMGENGPVRNILRFPDEPARHKILDLIGDLSLIGAPIRAHIIAVKSGHSLNLELVKKIRTLYIYRPGLKE